jgi:hypothetical protein
LPAQPLVNVHDVVVATSHRGRGIAAQLFAEVEAIARERGACKLTLEVLDGNASARALYQRLGFTAYLSTRPRDGAGAISTKMAGLKRTLCMLWLALFALAAHPAWAAAPAMLLAEVYAADIDVSQYWVSEKFDGVRAQWDGRTLRFRGGGNVPAPAWFTANFPAVPLDGELWIARDQFDALSGTVRKLEPVDAEWRQVRYLIFELPDAAGDFSERVRQMQTIVELAGVPWLQAVEQTRVTDHATLSQQLDALVRLRFQPDQGRHAPGHAVAAVGIEAVRFIERAAPAAVHCPTPAWPRRMRARA